MAKVWLRLLTVHIVDLVLCTALANFFLVSLTIIKDYKLTEMCRNKLDLFLASACTSTQMQVTNTTL